MTLKVWNAVDQYVNDQLVSADPALSAALQDSNAAGLPQINVSPSQGKLLQQVRHVPMLGAAAH